MTKYTPMIRQYLSIKEEVGDAFLFFRLGDFYELFFEDAIKAAEELEITLTGRGAGEERIPMCGVPYHSAEGYIQRLIEKGYKVAICEQVEDPATAKGVVKREVVRVVTPGTVIEENLLAEHENNFLVVLASYQGVYALAASDLSTGECHVTTLDGEVEALDEVLSYRPKEVLLDPGLATDKELTNTLTQRLGYIGGLLTVLEEEKIPSWDEMENRLEKQFASFREACPTKERVWVMGLLLIYLEHTQKRSLGHMNRIRPYDSRQFMFLDDAARRTLELTETLREGKRQGSLLGLIDRTATAMGSRLLKKWLDKPLLKKEEIEARLDAIQALRDDLLLLEEIREQLKAVYDLERLAARIAYGSASGRDLQGLLRSLRSLPKIKEHILQRESEALRRLVVKMDLCQDVADLIDQAIVNDPPLSVKEGGVIKDGYDAELDRLRSVQKEGKEWLAQLEAREREETGIKSLKVGYNRVFGYYIEVTKPNLHLLPEGRYQRKQTLAGSERFITQELKEREQSILDAAEKSMELEYQLFVQVREKIAKETARLQALAEQVAQLDVLQSLASVAHRYHYVRPTFSRDRFYIKGGRHPVVEAAVGEEHYVPNDTELSSKRQILLITGPNMAGKSTYMRQVALIAIMAQIGSFVPAEKAEVPILDRIFTRIGAADDLAGGRSTFMVEMTETCTALSEATPRSLILLDEVGRGTSTYDGMALAQAICEYIHDRVGAMTLFSTHYHELTELEQKLPRVANVHARCVEREGKVVFLYRVEPGRADKSYGIHVAELAGMPKEAIHRAQAILEQLEGKKQVAATEQLDLFQFVNEPETTSNLTSTEIQVLESIREWDLLGTTPMESLQFLMEIQKKLKESGSSKGEQDG